MSLIKFVKEDPDARKIFGKRELKIMEKQLLGVSLTQSEKNRLSRDIRKKLEVIAKISGFEDEFRLKKGAEVKKLIRSAKDAILGDGLLQKIERIVLYGSAAENKLSLQSDIDIAVKFRNISLQEATLFRKRIMGKINNKIDLQVYNHLPKKIQAEVDGKGKVIWQNADKGQDGGN